MVHFGKREQWYPYKPLCTWHLLPFNCILLCSNNGLIWVRYKRHAQGLVVLIIIIMKMMKEVTFSKNGDNNTQQHQLASSASYSQISTLTARRSSISFLPYRWLWWTVPHTDLLCCNSVHLFASGSTHSVPSAFSVWVKLSPSHSLYLRS